MQATVLFYEVLYSLLLEDRVYYLYRKILSYILNSIASDIVLYTLLDTIHCYIIFCINYNAVQPLQIYSRFSCHQVQ